MSGTLDPNWRLVTFAELTVTCSQCKRSEALNRVQVPETTTYVLGTSAPFIGDWRRVPNPDHGHFNPLSDDAVVLCSATCGERYFDGVVDRLWHAP